MFKISYSPLYVHPLPSGHRFPMLKYELIPEQLLYEGTITPENIFAPGNLDEDMILRTHHTDYWKRLKSQTLSPAEIRRTGFPLSESLVARETCIVQGTIECCRYALQYGLSMNVAGGTHHAFTNRGEGFCLLNDIAVAANFLLHEKLASKILIVDLDVHQGNGTAEIFGSNKQVFTFSMHGDSNYPYRKEQSDLDIGLADNTDDGLYLSILRKVLPELLETQHPDFVFYQSGVDILSTDKLGRLAISRRGCKTRDEIVLGECLKHQIPLVVSMGGGYSPKISDIVEAHCNTFRLANDMYF